MGEGPGGGSWIILCLTAGAQWGRRGGGTYASPEPTSLMSDALCVSIVLLLLLHTLVLVWAFFFLFQCLILQSRDQGRPGPLV